MEKQFHEASAGRCPYVGRSILVAFLVVAAFVTVACGKKTPPLPPRMPMPPAVADLARTLQGTALTLTWTQPKSSGIDLSAIDGYVVYRAQTKLPVDCQGCPLAFTKVAEVPYDAGKMSHSETLRNKGIRYTYKVVPYTAGGQSGADSNTVAVDF